MIKQKPQSSGPGGGYLLFIIALAAAFGVGYKVGRDSAGSVTVSAAPTPATTRQPAAPPRAAATGRPRGFPAAEQPRLLWTTIGNPKYTLYLASFQRLADAEKEKQRLESRGLRGVEITEKSLPGTNGAPWYRLRYGTFDSREAAIEMGRQMTDRGLIRDFWPKELL